MHLVHGQQGPLSPNSKAAPHLQAQGDAPPRAELGRPTKAQPPIAEPKDRSRHLEPRPTDAGTPTGPGADIGTVEVRHVHIATFVCLVMDSIGRRTAPREPARGGSRPGPPAPFDVRGERRRTEQNYITTHTQSPHTQPPEQSNVCIDQEIDCIQEDAPNYLYSRVMHAPVITEFTDSTHTQEREPERSDRMAMYTTPVT